MISDIIAKIMGKLPKMGSKGQAGAGSFIQLLLALVMVVVVALVITNTLIIAGFTTGLWTLNTILSPLLFVIVFLVAIGSIVRG